MTDEEKTVWQESYDLDGGIYRLNVKSEKTLSSYDEKFILPLIINNQMTDEERDMLNSYHNAVYDKVSPFLSKDEQTWLKHYTRPV